MRVCIINHYDRNNGDRAALAGLLTSLSKYTIDSIDVSIESCHQRTVMPKSRDMSAVPWGVLSGKDPFSQPVKRVGYAFWRWPINHGVIYNSHFREAIKNSDVVFGCGGHHLTDIVGDIPFYRLALDLAYSILSGKKVIMLPQSLGPFTRPTQGKIDLARFILRNVKALCIRDKSSLAFVEGLGVSNPGTQLLPDTAFGLLPLVQTTGRIRAPQASVGVVVYGNYVHARESKIRTYTREIASVIRHLIDSGYKVSFIPMETRGSAADDRPLIKNVIRQCQNDSPEIMESDDIYDIVSEFGQNSFNIAYKYHSLVLSLLHAKPTIAIAYHQKSIDLMHDFGLRDFVLWDHEATSTRMIGLLERAAAMRHDIHRQQVSLCQVAHEKLNRFYESILGETNHVELG